jgi:hypothetical protein
MFDKNFKRNLYSIELAAWKSFRLFVYGFQDNKKEEKLSSIHASSAAELWQMSLKIYLLYSHLRFLLENLEAISDEQGEKFNHGIAKVEQWYQGRWDPAIVEDYC